jgi:hypothetical protein
MAQQPPDSTGTGKHSVFQPSSYINGNKPDHDLEQHTRGVAILIGSTQSRQDTMMEVYVPKINVTLIPGWL